MEENSKQPFLLRGAKETDLSFILSTWLKSFYHSSDFAKDIDKSTYYEFHQMVIKRILSRSPRIVVACDVVNPETIFGYICSEGPVLHFTYTKKAFRNLGIATALLNIIEKPKYLSHLTKNGKKFIIKNQGVRYNPYMT